MNVVLFDVYVCQSHMAQDQCNAMRPSGKELRPENVADSYEDVCVLITKLPVTLYSFTILRIRRSQSPLIQFTFRYLISRRTTNHRAQEQEEVQGQGKRGDVMR